MHRLSVVMTLMAALTSACGGADESSSLRLVEDPSLTPSIIGGTPAASAAYDAVVALSITKSGGLERCTGVLVDADLVLTAWHCVGAALDGGVSCDESGHSLNGDQIRGELHADAVAVHVGEATEAGEPPAARGRVLVHPKGRVLCDMDIALVVLDRRLTNVTPARVRLDRQTKSGDRIEVVGFGTSEGPSGVRLTRTLDVRAVGRRISASGTALAAGEFETGHGTCHGDSGGPSFDVRTGAVVGIVSRGGDCAGDSGHVHVMPWAHVDLARDALRITGGRIASEDGSVLHEERAAPRLDGGAGNACAVSSHDPPVSVGAWPWLALLVMLGARRRRALRGRGHAPLAGQTHTAVSGG